MSKFRSRLELHSIINGQPARQVLAAATDVCVRESLNGMYYVTFTYPKMADDKLRYDAITEAAEVKFPDGIERGQTFVIKRVDEERRGLRIYKRVEAHHIAFELNRYYLDDYVDFSANQPASFTLAMIGNGTPFTMAVEGTFANQDVFDFGEKRKHDLLSEVRELYDGELAYNNTEITLTTRKGANLGVEIRYRKNLTGITRKSHDMERITRLYGYGKNGLTIEGLPGHSVKYIDSQYVDPAHIFEGSVDFPEIEDQQRLLDAMQRHIKTVELPKVSYEIDFAQLEKVSDEFRIEAVREVGDTVTVIDELMGYRFDARVTEFERFPFEPKRGRITLANFRELDTSDYVWMATVGSKRAMVYTSENAVLKGIKYDDSLTFVDGLGMRIDDDQGRTMIRLGQVDAGQYGMTMYNKAGAKTIWQDAQTGDARFSGKLVAPVIDGGSIIGGTITGGTISGTYLNGTFINGGTITGSLIQTAPAGQFPRAEMSNTEQMFKVESSGDASIEMKSVGTVDSRPSLEFKSSEITTTFRQTTGANTGLYISGDALHAELGRITLRGYSGVHFLGWSNVISEGLAPGSVAQTLQQALDAKADSSRVASLEARVAALEAR